ncbi:hypothetical protein [Nocardioides sp. NPDC047086]|uniref:hypothetical protein n=1 Tax=Nocardioides sp. NPDC047086 TaxID=3154810 RepID=UPI0033DD06C7
MTAALPIPVEIEMPNREWRQVDPDSLGADDAAFAAVRFSFQAENYVPILSVRGSFRTDPASLEDIADETRVSLLDQGASVYVVKRTQTGSPRAPALVQLLEVEANIEGTRFDLYQAQVIEAVIDGDDPRKRIVLIFTVTCKYSQWATVGSEFRDFIERVVIVPGAEDILAAR